MELKELVDPSHSALIVIDLQNDCCHPDGKYAKTGLDISQRQRAAHNAIQFLGEARKYKVPVIHTKVIFSKWDQSAGRLEERLRAKVRRESCVEGTWGADFYEVRPIDGEAVILKNRYSAFKGTELDRMLRSRGITTLIVTGGGTQACVESTVRDAYEFDYDVVVVSDCCGTPAIEEHEPALKRMARLCGKVVESRDVLQAWS
jgi:ureidoacrylate peracid hydrolase